MENRNEIMLLSGGDFQWGIFGNKIARVIYLEPELCAIYLFDLRLRRETARCGSVRDEKIIFCENVSSQFSVESLLLTVFQNKKTYFLA